MNLSNQPSLTKLSLVLAQCEHSGGELCLLVNDDGEVTSIASTVSNIGEITSRNKFHIVGLRRSDFSGNKSVNYLKYLNQLYKSLTFCWENNLTGALDYDIISNILNAIQKNEQKIESPAAENDIISIFFNNNIHQQLQANY